MATGTKTERQEHLDWCKDRALAYVDEGDLQNAFASMVSDLGKRDDTANHLGIQFGTRMFLAGQLSTQSAMRDFINGFN